MTRTVRNSSAKVYLFGVTACPPFSKLLSRLVLSEYFFKEAQFAIMNYEGLWISCITQADAVGTESSVLRGVPGRILIESPLFAAEPNR